MGKSFGPHPALPLQSQGEGKKGPLGLSIRQNWLAHSNHWLRSFTYAPKRYKP